MTDQNTICTLDIHVMYRSKHNMHIIYPCNGSAHDLYISPFIDYWMAFRRMKSYISVYRLFYFATLDHID